MENVAKKNEATITFFGALNPCNPKSSHDCKYSRTCLN